MNNLAVILGMSLVGFLSLYFSFKLRDVQSESMTGEAPNKHFLLQLIFIFLFLSSMLFVANAVYKADSTVCDVVVANQTIVNVTQYNNYDLQCFSTDSVQGEGFYKAVLWIFRLSLAYIFFYFVYEVLKFAGWVVPKE